MRCPTRIILSCAAVVTIFASCGNSAVKSPVETVSNAFFNLAEETKYSNQVILHGSGADTNGSPIVFDITLAGAYDFDDPSNARSDLALDMNFAVGKDRTGARIDFLSENKTLYVRLNELTLPEKEDGSGAPAELLQPYLKRWFYVPIPENASSGSADIAGQQARLRGLLKEVGFFKEATRLQDTVIRGVSATEYAVSIDKDKLAAFFEEAAKIADQPFSPEDRADVTKGLDAINFIGSVWIGESDAMVRKIAGILSSTQEDGSVFKSEVQVEFWDFGKELGLEIPQDALPFAQQTAR